MNLALLRGEKFALTIAKRMKRALINFMLSIVCAYACQFVVQASGLQQEEVNHDKEDLLKLENEWLAAIAHHDTQMLDRILATEFVDTTYTGALRNKEQALLSAKSARPERGSTARLENLRIVFYGGRLSSPASMWSQIKRSVRSRFVLQMFLSNTTSVGKLSPPKKRS